MRTDEANKKVCSCGTTFKNFLDTGLFGCENCYTLFEEELLPILERTQGSTVHYSLEIDDEPQREREEKERNLDNLRSRYRDYLLAGNFEDAEKIALFLRKYREENHEP